MTRSMLTALVVIVMLIGAVRLLAQRTDTIGVPDLAERLAALDGTNAMTYFELAEEIAYEESSARALPVARQLYVIAYEVDRNAGAPIGLGSSVCLALADLAESHADRRWLLMLADAMRGRAIRSAPTEQLADVAETDRLIEAITHYRAGRFRDARDDLVRIGSATARAQGERLRGGGGTQCWRGLGEAPPAPGRP